MGLLIVNADDWGRNEHHTDAIDACFRAGRISSATGMVFMRDSERAASLAVCQRRPIGLHLNLIEPYDAAGVPAEVSARQRSVVDYFGAGRWRQWTFSPRRYEVVARCIADQMIEFRRLYGAEPTHLDGHRHFHQSPTVLLSPALPSGMKVRPSFTFEPGGKPIPNRVMRALMNRLISVRFKHPDRFMSIRALHPRLGGSGIDQALVRCHSLTFELMTHPGWGDELELLLGNDWVTSIAGLPIGSYRDL